MIVIKDNDKLYTSRFFIPSIKKEGLIKIDDRIKNLIGT